jgi:hypothetical protein
MKNRTSLSAQLLPQSAHTKPAAIYDISGAGMHLPGTRKSRGVAQRRHGRRGRGRVTHADDLQSGAVGIS